MSAKTRMPMSEAAQLRGTDIVGQQNADMPHYGMSAPPAREALGVATHSLDCDSENM